MSRTVNFELLGKPVPLSMGLDAVKEIKEAFGCDLEGLQDKLTAVESGDAIENIASLAAILARSAYRREKVRCALYHEEFKAEEPPDATAFLCGCSMTDAGALASAVAAAIGIGTQSEVELKPGKNAESHA